MAELLQTTLLNEKIWINVSLGNHDGNKSLTKPMLTYHHEGEWHYSEGNFIEDTSAINH